ncbi:sensor histidine kinase [Clostridium beijerinckii]|uniref:sensor histidine kinase n=1 Tax=Clostridium beijerinckii TaxID=1520 RepID=UPI0024305EBF|nr:sensor histidine kinase [Clostridium beijerinckii]MDG5853695.1 sensor histidine kinase [Clostridium beijerinckii]
MLKLSKSIHSTSLFFRVASVVLISVILVSISIGIITIKISKDILADTFSKSNYKVLTQISNELSTFNDNTINIMNAIDYIPDFQRYLSEKELTPQQNYRTLYNMFTGFHKMIPDKDLYDITVLAVGVNGNTYVASDYDHLILDTNEVLNSSFTKKALDNKNTVLYQYLDHGFTKLTKNSSTIVAIKVLCDKLTREPYGFVYVLISEHTFHKYYDYFVGNGNSISIISSDGTIVSSSLSSKIGTKNLDLYNISSVILNNNLKYVNTKLDSSDVAILSKHLPTYNFNIVGTIDKNIVLSEIYDSSEIIAVSILIASIFIAITFFVIRRTTKPISALVKVMPKIIHGDFNNHIPVVGSYEVRELSANFNYMLDGLNNYVHAQIKMQKEKRKAELHALQMQINPHFIYNTLASIKWLMWQGSTEKSIQTIDAFISLLRNTISNKNEMITIQEEIENLNNYVLINHIRYGDNINVNFFVMPNRENYIIPKLILQPFIENAFFHGFNERNNGSIHVFVNEQNQNLICEIIDNGVGMTAEEVKKILNDSSKKHEHFTSIGIQNVNDRIKLLYGDDYGISISSELGKGTTVRVTIPAQKEFIEN